MIEQSIKPWKDKKTQFYLISVFPVKQSGVFLIVEYSTGMGTCGFGFLAQLNNMSCPKGTDTRSWFAQRSGKITRIIQYCCFELTSSRPCDEIFKLVSTD